MNNLIGDLKILVSEYSFNLFSIKTQVYLLENDLVSRDVINKISRKQWNNMSKYKYLSEKFIREFQNKVNWNYISCIQKLSEYFIREFKDRVNWEYISQYQKLSENFIREFQNEVDWWLISKCQKLSESFIREFKDKPNFFSGQKPMPVAIGCLEMDVC